MPHRNAGSVTPKEALMPDAFLLSAARTPIGKYLGGLASVPAPQLGAVAVAEALERANAAPGPGARATKLSWGT